ncbi:MAG: flagellar export protein FliJ [Chitinophagales bacterium]
MKVFEFRLQTKLDLTCRQEDIAKAETYAKQRVFDFECEVLDSLHSSQMELFNILRSQKGGFKIDELVLYKDFQKVLRDKIVQQKETVLRAEELLEEARMVLMEIMKERKTLERLREKEYQSYLEEFMRIEQKIIDEAAVSRYWHLHNGAKHA